MNCIFSVGCLNRFSLQPFIYNFQQFACYQVSLTKSSEISNETYETNLSEKFATAQDECDRWTLKEFVIPVFVSWYSCLGEPVRTRNAWKSWSVRARAYRYGIFREQGRGMEIGSNKILSRVRAICDYFHANVFLRVTTIVFELQSS